MIAMVDAPSKDYPIALIGFIELQASHLDVQ